MPKPVEINLHRQSRLLDITFDDGVKGSLSCEYLRVHSPSAEVRGHSPSQAILQVGKEDVAINGIEPVGHYAVQLIFTDGHDSGFYTWDYLYDLTVNRDKYWNEYLEKLQAAGHFRKTSTS